MGHGETKLAVRWSGLQHGAKQLEQLGAITRKCELRQGLGFGCMWAVLFDDDVDCCWLGTKAQREVKTHTLE